MNLNNTFQQDVEFLSKYEKTIVLKTKDEKGQVLVCPAYQGRIMTSTSKGTNGNSFGWINYKLIAARQIQQHINVFGGEDRFWLGPEGGQFSFFFKNGLPFTFDQWYTPKEIDTDAFELTKTSEQKAEFTRKMHLKNYSNFDFEFIVNRNVKIFEKTEAEKILQSDLTGLDFVGFESENSITNVGKNNWDENSGMPSIWILGMMKPNENTNIVIPFKKGDLQTIVNDEYFGKVPSERLQIEDEVLFFKADGKYRSKIGISPLGAKEFSGSYDSENKTLTITQHSLHSPESKYVNSMWSFQENPFSGDVVNAYNDGPLGDGSQLGPFYELESSSPAANLKPDETLQHIHRTFHIVGEESKLNTLSTQLLGASIEKIKNAM